MDWGQFGLEQDNNSYVAQHANERDSKAGNEHIDIPDVYRSLA